jgi:hypothetical protein
MGAGYGETMRTMRRRRALARGSAIALVACVAAAACSSPGKGSLVLAISTDMQTPKDINIVSVFVSTNGVPKLDFLGRVTPGGTVTLPSTLAVLEPDDPSAEVRIRVTAFQEQRARVLRDVLTTVPHQRTALLRVPLSFLDDGSAQGTLPMQFVPGRPGGPMDGDTQFDPTDQTMITSSCDITLKQTSIAGTCSSSSVDSNKLADFVPTLVFGDGGTASNPACFNVDQCFTKGAPIAAATITTAPDGSCSFPLTPGQSGQDWNCALATTDGTGACTAGGPCYVPLESDPGEGFSVQPGKAVLMVPGVCKKLAAGAMLYVDKASCSTKTESAPVCEPTTQAAPELDGSAAVDATVTFDGGDIAPLADGSPVMHLDAASAPDAGSCKTDSACSGALPHCDTARGICVQCISADECPGAGPCQNGVCVTSPADAAQ